MTTKMETNEKIDANDVTHVTMSADTWVEMQRAGIGLYDFDWFYEQFADQYKDFEEYVQERIRMIHVSRDGTCYAMAFDDDIHPEEWSVDFNRFSDEEWKEIVEFVIDNGEDVEVD